MAPFKSPEAAGSLGFLRLQQFWHPVVLERTVLAWLSSMAAPSGAAMAVGEFYGWERTRLLDR